MASDLVQSTSKQMNGWILWTKKGHRESNSVYLDLKKEIFFPTKISAQ